MRHLLLVLVMYSALNAGAGVVPRHRHQHVDDAAQVQRVDTAYEAVEAYSDTTTYDAGDDDSASSVNIPVKVNSVNPADYGDPFTFYNALWTVGAGGIIIAILLTLLFLVFIFVPIIIVVLLIRYLFKRHNDRVLLREKGQLDRVPGPRVDQLPHPLQYLLPIRKLRFLCHLIPPSPLPAFPRKLYIRVPLSLSPFFFLPSPSTSSTAFLRFFAGAML